MSTISENLAALQQAKEDIAEAITGMGGTVGANDGFSSFAADIATIPAGGVGTLQDKTATLDLSDGDQEVKADVGYDGLSKVTITRPTTLVKENIKSGVTIAGLTGTYEGTAIANTLDGLVDGTLATFTMPNGKNRIHRYLFYGDTSLTSANLQGAIYIEPYAFYGTTSADIDLASTLTSIGDYAFYNAGKSSDLMELDTVSACSIGSYAFSQAKIRYVKGKYSSIGTYAFASCAYLEEVDISQCASVGSNAFNSSSTPFTKLHIVVNGTVSDYAFANATKINDLSIGGTITGTLGSYAFYMMGYNRSTPDQNVLTIDLSASTFTSVGSYAFGGSSASNALNYFIIKIPSTCSSLSAQAFYYIKNSNVYFTRETPATAQSSTFTGASNTVFWVPYNSVNAYRIKDNWTTQASNIQGWAPANTFSNGDTLPEYNQEGYGLTWYSDEARTTQVTTVADATQRLWCTVGTTIVAYKVSKVTVLDCTVTISDGTNTYSEGDMVLSGTSLTITTAATDQTKQSVYRLEICGTRYEPSSSATITASQTITVMCLYYNGQDAPVSPTLNDNSWEMIKLGCDNGLTSLWNIGDTKQDSNGHLWMLVDKQEGRYQKVGGGYTHAVFMKVPMYSSDTTWRTSTNSEHYGQSALYTKMQSGGSYYTTEDQDLAELVNDNKIIVKASQASSSTTVDVQCGFFAPANNEIGFSDWNYATYRETVCNGTTFGAFSYFSDSSTATSRRIKCKPNQSSAYYWWTRSRYSGSFAVIVNTDGSRGNYNATGSDGAVPCVAF